MESAGHDLKQLESHLFHLKKNADFFRKVVIPVKNNMRQLHKKQPAAMNSNLTKTRKFENFHVSPIICGVCVCVYKNNHGGAHASNLTEHPSMLNLTSIWKKQHSSTLARKKHSNVEVFPLYLQICKKLMNICTHIYINIYNPSANSPSSLVVPDSLRLSWFMTYHMGSWTGNDQIPSG